MSGEEKSARTNNEPKPTYNNSIPNWINGLNLAGFILLLSSFILVFVKIGTPIPAIISIILTSVLFAASAFVKLFKTADWINYCRSNKAESKFFDWLSLIAAVSFVLLFLLSGGFGLFINKFGASASVLGDLATHMAIGVVSFFALATIALLYSVMVRLGYMLGYFKFTSADLIGNLEDMASSACSRLKLGVYDDESLERNFNFVESQRNVSVYDKKHEIIKDYEFESKDDAEYFFTNVAVYYIRHDDFPVMSNLTEQEKAFVKQIAARASVMQEAERKNIIAHNTNKNNMLRCDISQVVNTTMTMIDRNITIPRPSLSAGGDFYNEFSTPGEVNQFFAALAVYYIRNREFPKNITLHADEKDYIKNTVKPKVEQLRRQMLSASVSVSSTTLVFTTTPPIPHEDHTDHGTVAVSLVSSTPASSSLYEGDASDGSGNENVGGDEKESKKEKPRRRKHVSLAPPVSSDESVTSEGSEESGSETDEADENDSLIRYRR